MNTTAPYMTADGHAMSPEQPTGPTHVSSLYLTPEELAARWNMVTGSLGQWRFQRKGPNYTKLGNLVRYRISDVEAFEAEGRIECRAA